MPIDFDALRGEGGQGVPDDGLHNARLDRAHVATGTSRGDQLVTNWSENGLEWETWSPLNDPQWRWQAKDLLIGLGIDLAGMSQDNDLTDALIDREGHTYQVRTDARRGTKGDRWFIGTTIEGVADPTPRLTAAARELAVMQERVATDVPADESDMAAPVEPVDDDIPF